MSDTVSLGEADLRHVLSMVMSAEGPSSLIDGCIQVLIGPREDGRHLTGDIGSIYDLIRHRLPSWTGEVSVGPPPHWCWLYHPGHTEVITVSRGTLPLAMVQVWLEAEIMITTGERTR